MCLHVHNRKYRDVDFGFLAVNELISMTSCRYNQYCSILCSMKVNFRTFKISWTTYFLNYFCETLSRGRSLVDCSIVVFSKSYTLPNVGAFIFSTTMIACMGFPRLCAAIFTESAHECTWSRLYDVCHARYVVPQCWPGYCRGLKSWLQFAGQGLICGNTISRNANQTDLSKLKTIKHILQMYG